MLHLYEVVRTKKDYPDLNVTTENIGTVVDVLVNGKAYTVEFFDENNETIEKALYTEFKEDELVSVEQ